MVHPSSRDGGNAPWGPRSPANGGPGKVVEVDEAYHGKYDTPRERKTKRYTPVTKRGRSGPAQKRAIISLLDRDAGNVRSFHVPTADAETVAKIVRENVTYRQPR